MAYAALISLKHKLERLLNSPYLPTLFPNSEIESVYQATWLSQTFLEKKHYLPTQIEDSILKLNAVIESHVPDSDQFPETTGELQQLKQEMVSFVETVKQENWSLSESPSPDAYFSDKRNMVGLHDQEKKLERRLVGGPFGLEIVSVVGMAGIGKTTLVDQVYDNENVAFYFDYRVYVRVGPECHLNRILSPILAQLMPDPHSCSERTNVEDDMYNMLRGKRYLIVLDDVWSVEGWDEIRKAFPDDFYGSRVVVTTRLEEVALSFSKYSELQRVRFLDKQESWDLLCEKVFGESSCPPKLEKVGKKIAQNCEGLPLAIITVGNLLSKAEKTLEYWNKVAESDYLVVAGADENSPISKSLFLSYKYLPKHLKPCFLYLGAFPQSYEIPLSKLTRLWDAEGFLEEIRLNASGCLEGLVSRSLVLLKQSSSRGGIKTCNTHHVFWHLCVREAEKEDFFYLMNHYATRPPEGIHRRSRLCTHNNVLFGIKYVEKLMELASNVCSLLCVGPVHPYPVPLHLGLKLLKVLDALTIRFYDFPTEIVELASLRYLALTFNGKLPPSISKLQNLKYLIVHTNLSVISPAVRSYMPVEIWNMQGLRHLQCMGSDLPDLLGADHLPNLLMLSDISPHSCRREILQKIPNLKRLGIRIVLVPDLFEPLHIFDHLALLSELEALKCVVANPNPRAQVLLFPNSIYSLPSNLRKITLSGCGFAWKDMSLIGALPNLEVLKLRCHAVKGAEWEPTEEEFPQLEYLLLEDVDLVNWRGDEGCFPWLERLSIRHCYKLEEMPGGLGDIVTLQMIELVDCSPSAVASAKQIEEQQYRRGNVKLQVQVHSSWDPLKRMRFGPNLMATKDSHDRKSSRPNLTSWDGTKRAPRWGESSVPNITAWGAAEEARFIHILLDERSEAPLNDEERIEVILRRVAWRLSNHFNRDIDVNHLRKEFYNLRSRFMTCLKVLSEPGVSYDPFWNTVNVPLDIRNILLEEDPNSGKYFEEAEEHWEAIYKTFHDSM